MDVLVLGGGLFSLSTFLVVYMFKVYFFVVNLFFFAIYFSHKVHVLAIHFSICSCITQIELRVITDNKLKSNRTKAFHVILCNVNFFSKINNIQTIFTRF